MTAYDWLEALTRAAARPAEMIDAALELAGSAWEVFPCRPSGPQAKSPLTLHGHHDATMDPDQIKAWWLRWPDAMIGAAVPDAYIVIDVDPRNGGDLESLVALVGDLPPTLTVWSGRNDGGRHLYYQRPAGALSSTRLPEGIDLKANGYCIVPPSIHPATGLPYRWEERPVAETPPALVELLTPAPVPSGTWSVPTTVPTAGKLAGLLRKVAEAPDRNRNKILFWAGCRVAEANYPAEAWDALANAGRAAGLPDHEIRKAIRQADRRCSVTATDEWTEQAREIMDWYHPSDDGNALRLVTKHGAAVRRVSDMRKWHHWDGVRWVVDHESRAIREIARDLARQLPEATKEDQSFKRNSMSSTGISGCVRVAETDPRISVLAAALDAHPELINTPSGVVDLRTATVRPHDPDLLLTRITAHGVDLDAPHPRWDAFLAETFDKDDELISYMQRLAGLASLGNVRDHILPFLHGVGANGTGVFALVLQGLLGDADTGGYAVSAPDGFLMTGRDGAHPTEIARLRGARLVVCSEQTSGRRFDESKVKRLTGGDVLTGRFMRGDFFDFPPSHLAWVLSNHLPEVREGGPSFWRRVRKIPFLHVVPDDQWILDLHEQLLADEGSAILGWAVRGAAEVLANGLNDPDSVIKATRDYEISEDSLASFVRDECLLGPNWWVAVSDFRARYVRHCEEMGAEPLTAKALGTRLTSEYPVTQGRLSRPQRRTYVGIQLQAPEDE